MIWAIGLLNCGTSLSGFRAFLLFRPADPPRLGAGGDLGILATPAVAQDCAFSFSAV